MLGLAILIGLAVWLLITLVTMLIGYKIGKRSHRPKTGMAAGFMLTMGGWFVYWAIEFAYIQAKVSYLCKKEGKISVYVTPEQWRKQIGEEEWRKSFYTGTPDKNFPEGHKMIFNGREYHVSGQINQRIRLYKSNDWGKYGIKDVFIKDLIVYDIKLNKVLYYQRIFSAKSAPGLNYSLEALKFWLDYGIHNCGWGNKVIDEDLYASPQN